MLRRWIVYLCVLLLGIVTAVPGKADLAYLTVSGNPVTAPTAPYITLLGLTGQSGCAISVSGSFSGTLGVEGFYLNGSAWTPALTVVSPDGVSSSTSITSVGNYAFNCATMTKVRVDATSATGTPSVVLNASQGVSRILGAGVNGGRTIIAGTLPIQVINVGNTATVSIATPIALTYGGTGTSSIASGCVTSNGTALSGGPCPTPTPVSVTAGTGVTVATPAPGVFQVANSGVLSVSGTGNIASTGGQNPTVSITNAPTFTGQLQAANLKDTALTSGDCLQSISGVITSASTACPNGSIGSLTAGTGITISTPNPNSPTVSLTVPVAIANGGTNNTSLPSGCLQSNGTTVSSIGSNCGTGSGTVTSVTGSGNIASSGGTTPNVTITNSPTFTGTVTGGSFDLSTSPANGCMVDVANILTSLPFPCLPFTSAGFVVPAIGSAVTVNTGTTYPVTLKSGAPLTITDGTTNVSGYVVTSVNAASSFSFNVQRVNSGIVGNTIASGSPVYQGGYDAAATTGITAGTNIVVTTPNPSSPTVSTTQAPTFTGVVTTGNVADSGLSVSQCVGTDTAKFLVSNTNCVQSVTAGGNVTNTGTAVAPIIGVVNPPTFTGESIINTGGGYANSVGAGGFGQTSGCSTTCNQQQAYAWTTNAGTGINGFIGGDSTKTTQGVSNQYFQVGDNNNGTAAVHVAIDTTSGNIGTDGTITTGGTITAPNLIDSGLAANSCVSTNGSKQLNSGGTCVNNLSAGTGITISGPAYNPTVTVANSVNASYPTNQIFLSGSGTYTLATGVRWIKVVAVGAGGGGSGSGSGLTSGGNGGNTTFGTSLIVANGGAQGTGSGSGAGGTASLGTATGMSLTGGMGQPQSGLASSYGPDGGSNPLGGAGFGGGTATAGTSGITNTGGGGGGGGTGAGGFVAGAGGAGGYVNAMITAPSATYAYAVGAAGTAGVAGTGGNNGGAGGSGGIWVEEHYNY